MNEIMRRIDFFADLADDELAAIHPLLHEVRFAAGEEIFREGDEGNCLYIILDGRVEIRKLIRENIEEQAELKTFEPLDYFGEMSLVDNTFRSASAKAATDVKLLRIWKNDFLQICIEHPRILFHLMQTISLRLRHSNEQFADVLNTLLMKNKMAAIGTAAAKIVHDIKNPITVIILTAQLMEALYPETAKYVSKIVKQTETMNEMVHEILDYSRGENIALDIESNDLAAFLGSVHEDLEALARDLHIELAMRNEVAVPVSFDNKRMKRVVVNIVKNAMEAIRGEGRVELIATVEAGKLHLAITDNGPGIPEDLLPTIFEPFVTRGKKTGTGLGLAISQKIVADHHGSIVAANGEKGARFDIYLPIAP